MGKKTKNKDQERKKGRNYYQKYDFNKTKRIKNLL